MLFIGLIFFIVALFYSMVGFGGGSSYIAILAAFDVPYQMIPKVSLLCNIIVVAGGCWHYHRSGLIDKKLTLPFVLTSVPFAFLGGSFPLAEKTFFILLTLSLIVCGARILFIKTKGPDEVQSPSALTSSFVGAGLGLLSGMVGIGGGIFLSPVLINMGWARSKNAAAVASVFILLNSVAGLFGQLLKGGGLGGGEEYIFLFIAVALGGQIGSRLSVRPKTPYSLVQIGTGMLALLVGARIFFRQLL